MKPRTRRYNPDRAPLVVDALIKAIQGKNPPYFPYISSLLQKHRSDILRDLANEISRLTGVPAFQLEMQEYKPHLPLQIEGDPTSPDNMIKMGLLTEQEAQNWKIALPQSSPGPEEEKPTPKDESTAGMF